MSYYGLIYLFICIAPATAMFCWGFFRFWDIMTLVAVPGNVPYCSQSPIYRDRRGNLWYADNRFTGVRADFDQEMLDRWVESGMLRLV